MGIGRGSGGATARIWSGRPSVKAVWLWAGVAVIGLGAMVMVIAMFVKHDGSG